LSLDSLANDHRDRAEKEENKGFWDGIIRDRDRDRDRERARGGEREIRDKDKDKAREMDREREARESLWLGGYNPSELTRMIGALVTTLDTVGINIGVGYFIATSSEDWALVLDVCERAFANEANAKEAVKALRKEFKCVSITSPRFPWH
jgi:hypothetical protein